VSGWVEKRGEGAWKSGRRGSWEGELVEERGDYVGVVDDKW